MRITKAVPIYIAVLLENTETRDSVWLPLPAKQERFTAALRQIGVSGGEFQIVRYAAKVPKISSVMLMRTPLSVVNYLAARLNRLTNADIIKLCAICDTDYYFDFIGQYIDYTFAPDDYTLLLGVTDAEALGNHYLGSIGERLPELRFTDCVDRREYGKSLAALENGAFTPFGYVTSKTNWNNDFKDCVVPASLNLKGSIGEDIYGDWKEADWDYGR